MLLLLCWLPAQSLPVDEGGSSWITFAHADKVVHLGLFGLFGILWGRVRPGNLWATKVVLGGILLATLTEAGQALPVIGRDANVPDALADTAGLVLGVVATRLPGLGRISSIPAEPGVTP
jgi:VanZ family protein